MQLTDEWFSYSVRGEVTGVWEKTPHSGSTYYYVSSTYWADGTLASLSGLGLPALAYGGSAGSGLDGEGRIAQVTAGSATIASGTAYNVAGQPTGVTFGSGDSDGYGYDPNTGRQTGFQANVGGTNPLLSGTLSWNANASLGQLTLNYNGGTETCNYTHDDLSRVASVSCNSGAAWGQTFELRCVWECQQDRYGNWLPGYNQSTNQMSSMCPYDANGDLLSDGVHSYTWDGNWGNPSAIDAVSLTYDALGRMVEQNRSGTYTQVVYSPTGAKLALMNGQSLQEAFVPLPGGGTAVYNSGGLAYYRHPDWLGSSRLATTTSRTVYAYTGYAPFGESYEGQGSTDLSFTGQNQDTVSGLNDFLYREYSPAQGRWISPDPAGSAAVDPTNPQSWNRYGYVGNSPLASVDPLGLFTSGQPPPPLFCYNKYGPDGGVILVCEPNPCAPGFDPSVWFWIPPCGGPSSDPWAPPLNPFPNPPNGPVVGGGGGTQTTSPANNVNCGTIATNVATTQKDIQTNGTTQALVNFASRVWPTGSYNPFAGFRP